MASVNHALGAAGEPPFIEHDGKTYRFQRLTQRAQGRFEEWAKREQWKAISSAPNYQAAASALGDRIAAGEFDWGEAGLIGLLIAKTGKGILGLLHILATELDPKVTEDEVKALIIARPDETFRVLKEVYPEVFDAKPDTEPAKNG